VSQGYCEWRTEQKNHRAEIREETFNTTVVASKSIERACYSGSSPIRNSKWWSGDVSALDSHRSAERYGVAIHSGRIGTGNIQGCKNKLSKGTIF